MLPAGTFVASGYYAPSGSPTRCPKDTYASAPRLLTDASDCSACTDGFTTNLTDGNAHCGERAGCLRVRRMHGLCRQAMTQARGRVNAGAA
jgi:hypothetical protein